MEFQFQTAQEFFAMGGHGMFIWLSYAIVFSFMLYFGFLPNWKKKQFINQQRRIRQQQSTIQQSAEQTSSATVSE